MNHTMKGTNELDTPALLLDEVKMKRNIERMMRVRSKNVEVRPHFKTHKSITIAKFQLEKGACGITVATAAEAELLLQNGIYDILVAFPISAPNKLLRLLKWADRGRVILTVDNEEQVALVESIATTTGVLPEVWIKVNSGLNRCGVEPGAGVLNLAKRITAEKKLNLTGIYTHAGHSYAASSQKAIQEIAKEEAECVIRSAILCEKEGILIKHRSVGSTPTFEKAAEMEGITEVRPGNAVFFDGIQVGLGVAKEEEVALTILTTVSSLKHNRLIIDAGSKALTTEKGAHGNEVVKGFGKLRTAWEIYVTRVSEEHGIVDLKHEDQYLINDGKICMNDKIKIIPNHACPVVNLFDHYYIQRENGSIEKLTVDGRGKSQ